ncbi:MAG: YrhB domain-containing protein [Phototrophicaceae bacterium]
MTAEEAIDIARTVLYREIDVPDNDDIICTHIEQTDEGWYIECNSRIYTETDDLLYALVLAPLMIFPNGKHKFIF